MQAREDRRDSGGQIFPVQVDFSSETSFDFCLLITIVHRTDEKLECKNYRKKIFSKWLSNSQPCALTIQVDTTPVPSPATKFQ